MDAMINLFHKCEHVFWQQLSQKTCAFPELTAYLTGVNHSYLNLVIQKENLTRSPLESYLEKMGAFYGEHTLPWTWVVKQEFSTLETVKAFQEIGFDQIEESVAMACVLDKAFKENPQKEFIIQEDKEDLKAWVWPVKEAFRAPPKPMKQYQERHQNYGQDVGVIKHYVGFYQDEPIAATTLTVSPYGARLDDVTVCPAFQGQGYGQKILEHSLREAQKLGAKMCFLEASQDGLRLYQKVGFQELFINKIFG